MATAKKKATVSELRAALKEMLKRNKEVLNAFENSEYFCHAQYSTNEVSEMYTALLLNNDTIARMI